MTKDEKFFKFFGMKGKALEAGLVIGLLLSSLEISAEPLDFYCAGPRSRAIGCTGIAISGGYEAAYLNPALISSERNIGIGYLFSAQSVDVFLRGEKLPKVGNPLDDVRLMQVGLAFPLSDLSFLFERSKVLDNISLGAAIALPLDPKVARVGTVSTKIPATVMYGNRNTRFSAYTGLSGRIPLENLRIYAGAGLSLLAKLPVEIGANVSPDRDLVSIDGALELKEGFLGGIALEVELGSMFLRVGSTARTSVQAEITPTIRLNTLGDERILEMSALLFDLFTPSYIGGGIGGGVKMKDVRLSMGFDVAHYRFSALKLPLLEVSRIFPDQLKGLIPTPKLPEFQDVMIIKGGISADIFDAVRETDLISSLGINLFPSPLKSQNGTLFVDSDRLTILGGLGVRFRSPAILKGETELMFSGGLQILRKREFDETRTTIEGKIPILSVGVNISL